MNPAHVEQPMTLPTDEELLLQLKNFEDNFVERKTVSDSKDWLKTAVAFANSVPVGYPAVMFVGVRNDGTVQTAQVNLETLQRSISEEINKAYPMIYHLHRVLRDSSGNPFIAVIIPGSAERPHFAGQAYIRVGSDSKPASEPQFQNLIAQRQGKTYELLKWKGEPINLVYRDDPKRLLFKPGSLILEDCNQFYLTYSIEGQRTSISLSNVNLSFDDKWNCLKLEVGH
jgi:predicted HTH transcriptional regulator